MTSRKTERQQLLALVNAHRRPLGLRPLRLNKTLNRTARLRALRIVARRLLSHDGWVRAFKRSGYFQVSSTVGENIAEGHPTIAATNVAWLASPEHRRNYEDEDYREMGFARIGRVRVQTFGARR